MGQEGLFSALVFLLGLSRRPEMKTMSRAKCQGGLFSALCYLFGLSRPPKAKTQVQDKSKGVYLCILRPALLWMSRQPQAKTESRAGARGFIVCARQFVGAASTTQNENRIQNKIARGFVLCAGLFWCFIYSPFFVTHSFTDRA